MAWLDTLCTAFEGGRCIASGRLSEVAPATKLVMDNWASSISAPPVLIFDNTSSEVIELDWRGSPADFWARLQVRNQSESPAAVSDAAGDVAADADGDARAPAPASRGPGRPKLGVVAREVTLLPRHWEWLATQPGGASVALRKLVELASRISQAKDRVRRSSEVGYKFMSTMASGERNFEEASRALFAGDKPRFDALVADWPADVQTHLHQLLADAFAASTSNEY